MFQIMRNVDFIQTHIFIQKVLYYNKFITRADV